MTVNSGFQVKFWGVRGSIACPGQETLRYGGNTSCVEMRCGDRLLIFDAGSGLRPLGQSLVAEGRMDGDLFFSHTHFDHIVGLPFFQPLFDPNNKIHLWAGHLVPDNTLKDVLSYMMAAPLFPVPLDVFRANCQYHDFRCGETLQPEPDLTIRTAPLDHPDGATGYRVEYGGHAVCYVTDTSHTPGQRNADILALIQGADIVIYDSTYTDDEFPNFADWGHSTWQEGTRLCDAAGAKTLVIFHHDPSHNDAFMDRIATEADQARPGTVVAQEGLVLTP